MTLWDAAVVFTLKVAAALGVITALVLLLLVAAFLILERLAFAMYDGKDRDESVTD